MTVRLSGASMPASMQAEIGSFLVRGIVRDKREDFAAAFIEAPREVIPFLGSPLLFTRYRPLPEAQRKRFIKGQRVLLTPKTYAIDNKAARASTRICMETELNKIHLDGTCVAASKIHGQTIWRWPKLEAPERIAYLQMLAEREFQKRLDQIPGEKILELKARGPEGSAQAILEQLDELLHGVEDVLREVRAGSHPEIIWIEKPKELQENSMHTSNRGKDIYSELPLTLYLEGGGTVIVDRSAACWSFDVNTTICRDSAAITAQERCNNEAVKTIIRFIEKHDICGQIFIDFVGSSPEHFLKTRSNEIFKKLKNHACVKVEEVLRFNVVLIARGH